MRILLAAKYVPGASREIGGVQSWVATVAAELRRIGHEVALWCPEWTLPAGRFDLGILANLGLTGAAVAQCDQAIAVSHGIIEPERPPADMPVVFTSEGVREFWGRDGAIIRQPIDLQFWSPGDKPAGTLVRYSYRGGLAWLPNVAERLGLKFVHLRNATHEEAREVLRGASCVLASGRAVLEAAACGVPVVVCDHRSAYQGPLLAPFGTHQTLHNYSGRTGVIPDLGSVREMVQGMMQYGDELDHVRDIHDVRRIVPQLLEAACCTC